MTERLLQYIWQFQHFNNQSLFTLEGEPLQVIHPGFINSNQGPDFTNAKIRVNETIWAGSIEVHIKSSDWVNHKHNGDKNYQNVILHVVWRQDIPVNLPCPTLELQDRVPKILLSKFEEMMRPALFIPCEKKLASTAALTWQSWKERLLTERLQHKTAQVYDLLQKNSNHWEETCWWMIARNFGVKQNSETFEAIARSLPLNLLAKHKNSIHQTEALLFGQAGLLDTVFREDYPLMLQKEYQFLKKKYSLQPVNRPVFFLRMRPLNFPTVRLAQVAMLIHNSRHLFAQMRESSHIGQVRKLLEVTANDYWHYHFVFEQPVAYQEKKLGNQMIDNILINTVIPLLFAYGHYHTDSGIKERALRWLESVRPEINSITRGYTRIGVTSKSALDTQALIQLNKEYCNKKRCLDCAVGNSILRNNES